MTIPDLNAQFLELVSQYTPSVKSDGKKTYHLHIAGAINSLSVIEFRENSCLSKTNNYPLSKWNCELIFEEFEGEYTVKKGGDDVLKTLFSQFFTPQKEQDAQIFFKENAKLNEIHFISLINSKNAFVITDKNKKKPNLPEEKQPLLTSS